MIKLTDEDLDYLREIAFSDDRSKETRLFARALMQLLEVECKHEWRHYSNDRWYCNLCESEREKETRMVVVLD